jgi:6,7-dimethyl-8-ribityllumazine synthase
MSTADKNSVSTHSPKIEKVENVRIGIVTAEWNHNITFALRDACIQELESHGCKTEDIIRIEVPGAFELPFGAKVLLTERKLDAVICLGCVIKGETKHDEYISQSVATGIMSLSLTSGKPVIFGVLTPNDMQQAKDRAGGKYGNKGIEAAQTALQMIQMSKHIKTAGKSSIGF